MSKLLCGRCMPSFLLASIQSTMKERERLFFFAKCICRTGKRRREEESTKVARVALCATFRFVQFRFAFELSYMVWWVIGRRQQKPIGFDDLWCFDCFLLGWFLDGPFGSLATPAVPTPER